MYDNSPVPESPEDLRRFINDELEKIRDALSELEDDVGTDFYLEVARGAKKGYSIVNKFGHSDAISTTLVPICSGNVYQTPTTAQSLELVSTASTDNQAGVGARTLTIQGLDANFNEVTVVANMHATDGTIAEAVTGTWIRIYRMYVETSGTYASQIAGSHVGTVTLQTVGGGAGTGWAVLELHGGFPAGQSNIGVYTVPAGKTGYIGNVEIETDTNKAMDILFFQRQGADDVTVPYKAMRNVGAYTGISDRHVGRAKMLDGPFPEKTDIGFMAQRTSAGTSSTSINSGFIAATCIATSRATSFSPPSSSTSTPIRPP